MNQHMLKEHCEAYAFLLLKKSKNISSVEILVPIKFKSFIFTLVHPDMGFPQAHRHAKQTGGSQRQGMEGEENGWGRVKGTDFQL